MSTRRISMTPRQVIGWVLFSIPVVVFVVGMTWSYLAEESYHSARRTETFAWDAGPAPTVRVDLAAGTVTVAQGTDGRVSARLARLAVTRAGQDEADAALAAIVVKAVQEGTTIRIETTAPAGLKLDQLKADLELRVPADATLDLTARRGDVLIGKVAGDAYGAYLINSPVALRAARARTEGETYVGIEAELAPRPGLPPTTLDLTARRGDVAVRGANLRVAARAEAGSVRFVGRPAPGLHRFATGLPDSPTPADPARQGISLTLPADLAVTVDARSRSGPIASDFPGRPSTGPEGKTLLTPADAPAPVQLELRTEAGPIEVRKAPGGTRL